MNFREKLIFWSLAVLWTTLCGASAWELFK